MEAGTVETEVAEDVGSEEELGWVDTGMISGDLQDHTRLLPV